MTKQQYLLAKLMEEAGEIVLAASKSLTFGIDEIKPGQDLTNKTRLKSEIEDLIIIIYLLKENGIDLDITKFNCDCAIDPSIYVDSDTFYKKKEKVEKYMNYSKELGVWQ